MFDHVACCFPELETAIFPGCHGEFQDEYFVILTWKGEEMSVSNLRHVRENVDLGAIWQKIHICPGTLDSSPDLYVVTTLFR